LERRGKKHWKKEFFVLSENRLITYRGEDESANHNITEDILRVSISILPVSDKPFSMEIKLPKDCLVVSAESEGERLEWINTIRNIIRKRLEVKKDDPKMNQIFITPEIKPKNKKADKKKRLSLGFYNSLNEKK